MTSICGVCKTDIGRKRSLLCTKCHQSIHTNCDGVSKEVFSLLDNNRNLLYTCKSCMENPPETDDDEIESDSFKAEMRKEFTAIKNSFRLLGNDLKKDQSDMKTKFESVVCEIRNEISVNMKEIKDEVTDCIKLVNSNDAITKNKLYELELQNHVLQLRLNRSDIIISGLSDDLTNLNEAVIALSSHLKVSLVPEDVLNVIYIKKKSAILVKFCQIAKRDQIMSAYYKEKALTRSDVEGGNISTRVYLNDNYSSLANKLLRMCWKLAKDGKIVRYSIINREVPKAKLTMPNNSIKILNINECIDFFQLNT